MKRREEISKITDEGFIEANENRNYLLKLNRVY